MTSSAPDASVAASIGSNYMLNVGPDPLGRFPVAAIAWTQSAVPEPTSGVLFLLGLASLALRRKKA